MISVSRMSGLVFSVLLLLVCGCGGSAGGTLSTGRTVVAHSDSFSLSSSFSKDTATVKTAGRTIVVAPASLIVDGLTVAEIDEGISKVEVAVKRGAITFVADGRAVATFR